MLRSDGRPGGISAREPARAGNGESPNHLASASILPAASEHLTVISQCQHHPWESPCHDIFVKVITGITIASPSQPAPPTSATTTNSHHNKIQTPIQVSQHGKSLIFGLLDRDAEKRFTALDALAHPWIQQLDQETGEEFTLGLDVLNALKDFTNKTALQKATAMIMIQCMPQSDYRKLQQVR
jgi:serine/threonine protein kinase